MPDKKSCTHPENHQQHLCELEKRLSRAELNRLRRQPKYVCANCGGKMDRGRNLCAPKRIRN